VFRKVHTKGMNWIVGVGVIGAILLLPACGTYTKQVQTSLNDADKTIQDAQAGDAPTYASSTLKTATDHLASGKQEFGRGELESASGLAQRAKINAQVASVEAEVAIRGEQVAVLQEEIDEVNAYIADMKSRFEQSEPLKLEK